ncbi:MAG: hypothetical protein KGI58_03470 [Patescibacteria group bacterium]|nr:hypothetical protein [Patescibacteria group bacterium]
MKIYKKKKYSSLSKFAKYGFLFIFSFYMLMSFVKVNACDPATDPSCKPDTTATNNLKPDTTAGGGSNTNGININTGITNPLGNSFTDIPSFIKAILKFVLIIGVPIVTLAIIYSGFLFVTAQGNSEKLGVAKKTLLYTLIGAALLLGSLVITDSIQGTITEIKSTSSQ